MRDLLPWRWFNRFDVRAGALLVEPTPALDCKTVYGGVALRIPADAARAQELAPEPGGFNRRFIRPD
jgi:hypothetical protein